MGGRREGNGGKEDGSGVVTTSLLLVQSPLGLSLIPSLVTLLPSIAPFDSYLSALSAFSAPSELIIEGGLNALLFLLMFAPPLGCRQRARICWRGGTLIRRGSVGTFFGSGGLRWFRSGTEQFGERMSCWAGGVGWERWVGPEGGPLAR